jgi:cytochrome c553
MPSGQTTTPPTDGVGGGGTGPAAAEARKLFEDNVYPIVNGKCAACHSAAGASGNVTAFVATTKTDAYVTAVGYQAIVGDWTPTGAPILLKITSPAGHQNLSYTQDEKDKITAWLAKELESRAGGGGPVTPTGESPAEATVRLTKEWSGCMQLANFTAANMKAWGNMNAGNSACKTCHNAGEYGNIADNVDNPFFTVISTNKYYMAQYFSADLSKGVADAKMIINTRSFTGVGSALAPHIEHPRFTLTGSTGLAALQKFYDLTVAAKAKAPGTPGACGPSTLTN